MIKKKGFNKKNHNKSSQYFLYPNIFTIRQLDGYSNINGDLHPIWGKRFAIYHPIKSNITCLKNSAWEVFDLLKKNYHKIQDMLNANNELTTHKIKEIINNFKSRMIVLENQKGLKVKIIPDFSTNAGVYLQITEYCNFHCPGCSAGLDRYQPDRLPETMNENNLEELFQNIIESASNLGFKKLIIKWAGGEPLLPTPFKLIRKGQPIIKRLQKQYSKIKIYQSILTNGSFLKPELISEIKNWNVHLAVSLWGIGEDNYKARGVKKVSGYDIIEGIRLLHNAGIKYNINHVVTPVNSEKFGNFIRAIWDIQSNDFIGKDWIWKNGKKPIPLNLTFFRPQTESQIKSLRNNGYQKMLNGIRKGFEVILELIKKGVQIPSLRRIDYLQLFSVIPAPCGSGFNYLVVGPKGITSCIQGLLNTNNFDSIKAKKVNLFKTVNKEYKKTSKLFGPNISYLSKNDTINQILMLHGGSGCPRVASLENNGNFGYAAEISKIYEKIIEEILSLETMRLLHLKKHHPSHLKM